MNTAAIIIRPELEAAVAKTGLSADGAASLRDAFAPHFARFHDLADEARAVAATDSKGARALRLQVKTVRVEADKTRKALKEDSLRRGKAIDGINAVLEYSLIPVERALEDIEQAAERAEAARKDALRMVRAAELQGYLTPEQFAGLDLGSMAEELWVPFLAGTKASHEAKVALAAKQEAERLEVARLAEAARIVREAAEKEERERLRAENERLAQVLAEQRKQQDEIAATVRAELAVREASLAKERAEIVAKQNAIALSEAAEDARIRAEADVARKAKAAPDKEKVAALAKQVRALQMPSLTTPDGSALAVRISEQAQKFASWLESEGAKL